LKVVVVGGSAAGMAAAAKAKRMKPELDITIFEKSRYVSYAPCGIPYYFQGMVKSLDDLTYYPVEYFRKKRRLDVQIRHEVIDIDPSEKSVLAISLDTGREVKVYYDKLVLTTGGRPLIPPIKGVELDGIHTLRTLEDAEKLYKETLGASVIGIVGAGYIGLEMAEAFRALGKRVIMIEMLDQVLPSFDPEPSEIVKKELIDKGVELHLSEKVVAFEGGERIKEIVTEKDSYKVDLVLLATGVRPNTAFAEKIGLEIGVTGGVKVDRSMRTSDPDVYAAGDLVETIHLVTNKPVYNPLAPAANKMGRVVGENIAGGRAEFPGVVGTSIMKVFDLEVGKTGLSLREALENGFDAVAVDITHPNKSHYYPGYGKMNIRLVADKDSHRVLGAEIIGPSGVLARIDTMAAAVTAGFTTEQLKMLDLAYAPPFAPVWDGLIVAATVIEKKY